MQEVPCLQSSLLYNISFYFLLIYLLIDGARAQAEEIGQPQGAARDVTGCDANYNR